MNPLKWLYDRTGINWPRVLLVALAMTIIGAVVVAGATSTAGFGPYNPSWDGTSELRQDIDATADVESQLIRETSRYDDAVPNETVAFVIAPDESYSEQDVERVQRFVANGGTLVVLENFGTAGNELLADIGATARADGELLRDEQEYYHGPEMPVATGVEEHPLTNDIEQLTLNYASAVEPGEATVLVQTSEYAYRDINDDGQLNGDEELDHYPVATVENVSEGQVVTVSDPSIAVNAMINEPDNAAFLREIYTNSNRVLIDLSHADELPPLAGATLTLRESPLAQILVGVVGVGLIAVLSTQQLWPTVKRLRATISDRRPSIDNSTAPLQDLDDEQRAAILRQRHPDWDEQRIQRVIAALNRHGSERQNE